VRVTGLVITENEFPAGNGGRYDLFPTQAYAAANDRHTQVLTFYDVKLRDGATDEAAFDSQLRPLGTLGADDLDSDAAAVQRAIAPQAVGWWVLAGLIALAGLAVLGQTWIQQHPQQAAKAFQPGPGPGGGPGPAGATATGGITVMYAEYTADEIAGSNPAVNEMVKIGLWLELEIAVGFTAGLGLGSLTGQRTLTTIVLIGLEIIVTPILAAHVIPYFIDGQRLVVGVALDQLRPAALGTAGLSGGGPGGPGGPGRVLFGGRGALDIPLMPTWAMISVIVGWIVGWSVIGAWRMTTRDA
jgi:hypothetical protein